MRSQDGYVFVHIPKTAGTSLREFLAAHFTPERVSPPFPARPMDASEAASLRAYALIAGHISWKDVATHFPERQLLTFLRDPIDRCLSAYSFFRGITDRPLIPLDQIHGLNSADEAVSLARQLDPEDFFSSRHPHVLQNIENRMVWQLGHRAVYEERSELRPGDALRRAQSHLKKFFFVGFYERLNQDTERLRALLGMADPKPLPRANLTGKRLRANDLSPTTHRLLATLTQLDRQLYDAVFDDPSLRD